MKRIHQISKIIKESTKKELIFLVILLTGVSLVYSFISIQTHNRYMTFGLDLGYFDETIWKISRGIFPYSSAGCVWLLEDHFQPILYLLAPLYWIWENVRVILIFQSFWMVFSAVPLYLLSKKITRHVFISLAIVFAFLFFIGTQFAILNEFHQVTLAPFFIALLYLAVEKDKKFIYWFCILALFTIKEDMALLVSAIGIGLVFRKGWRFRGGITGVLGFLIFTLLVYVLMPLYSIKGVYDHFTHFKSIGGSTSPVGLIHILFTDPLKVLEGLVGNPIKINTIVTSFFTFITLPVFSSLFILIPLFADFSLRFLYEGPQITKWMLVNHNAATGAMLLAISSLYACEKLGKIIPDKKKKIFFAFVGLFLITATLMQDIFLKAPIHSFFKKSLYEKEEWMKNDDQVISQVPKDVSIAAQNNLLPHLTERNSAYRLPFGLNSDYIVIDFHDGPNNYAPLSFTEMKKFVNDWILKENRYSVIYQKGDAMLLKRNFKTDISKSPYYNNTHYCYYSFEQQ